MNKHLLDWSFFVKQEAGAQKFDGFKFEELVRDLLEVNIPGDWTATSKSWDGGKDFVDRSITDGQHWVECKMYKHSLSLKAISNTLVMAVSEQNVKKIVIFSYSQLNRQTTIHLSKFAFATGIEVFSFDGLSLEREIIKAPKVLDKYFNASPDQIKSIQNISVGEALQVKSFFSSNSQIELSQLRFIENEVNSSKSISLGDFCSYQIISHSKGYDEKQEISLNLEHLVSPKSNFFLLNEASINIQNDEHLYFGLKPGQLKSLKLYLKAKSSGKVSVPKISVKCAGKMVTELPELKLHVRGIHHPALIGSHILDYLDEFQSRISANFLNYLVVVHGVSGVGKSRYLSEVNQILLKHNYNVICFDLFSGDITQFNIFIRVLLARIWRLPEPISSDLESPAKFSSANNDTIFDEIVNIIYSNQDESTFTQNDIERLSKLVIEGIIHHKNAILVDNVQALDPLSIQFLRFLTDKLKSKTSASVVVLSFNEQELIFSEQASYFLNSLKSEAANNKANIQQVALKEFSEDQVELFLDNIIRLEKDGKRKSFSAEFPRIYCQH